MGGGGGGGRARARACACRACARPRAHASSRPGRANRLITLTSFYHFIILYLTTNKISATYNNNISLLKPPLTASPSLDLHRLCCRSAPALQQFPPSPVYRCLRGRVCVCSDCLAREALPEVEWAVDTVSLSLRETSSTLQHRHSHGPVFIGP